MKIRRYGTGLMLCLVGGIMPSPALAQFPAVAVANKWVADASHNFLSAHGARGRFQGRPFVVRQAFFSRADILNADPDTDHNANREYDAYVLSLTAGATMTEEDIAALVFGAPAPSDRFEITLYVQPGKTIRHRTVTVSPAGAASGIAFPGGREFLYQGSPPVQVTLLPGGKDITHAFSIDSASRDFTLRVRIETLDSKILQGAIYLCVNDEKKSFVEGRFDARALDDLALQRTVQHTRTLDEAIVDEDAAKLRALLKAGYDPNANLYRRREESRMNGEFGYDTLLTAAVVRGDVNCVAALLEAGAKIDLPNSAGATPLMIAALTGDLKLLNYLMEHGANVKAAGPSGKTALHFAVQRAGNLPICKSLLGAGADIDAADDQGVTPLITVALFERLETAQWLIDQHANINRRDKQGNTALYYGKTDAMRIMLLKAGAKR